jgi:putative transposase
MYKSFKYRIYPNEEQRILLEKHFGCTRFVYNYFLDYKQTQYKTTGTSGTYNQLAKELVNLKEDSNYSWLKEVNSQSLQQSLKDMFTSYERFFKGLSKFPKFKKKGEKNSFRVPQYCRIDIIKNVIYIPRFTKKGIKIKYHRKHEGTIKSMTISKTASGQYYVSVLCLIPNTSITALSKTKKSIGIDLGIKDYIVCSDRSIYPSFPKESIEKLRRKQKKLQKHFSRKQKGSKNREKLRKKIARIHERIHNIKLDYLHKLSLKLLKNYDIIYVEDLNIKDLLMKSYHTLSRNISEMSWNTFMTILQYKALWNNKEIKKIGKYYPSSKLCSHCGYIKKDLKLHERSWICPNCNTNHDRDYNASTNIFNEGIKIYGNSNP